MWHKTCSCRVCTTETVWRLRNNIPLEGHNFLSPEVAHLVQYLRRPGAHEDGDGDKGSDSDDDLPF